MVTLGAITHPFSLVGEDHLFAPLLAAFRAVIAGHCAKTPAPTTVHAEIKALPTGDGGWRLDRFYWSGQAWDLPGRLSFRADTLAYRADGGLPGWHHFPHDPYLGAMGATFDALLATRPAAVIDVLRYVPLRRMTFRVLEGGQPVLVGKLKRRSRFEEADQRLATVARAVAGREPGFRVARPAGVDAALGLTMQEALPGRNLAELIAAETALPLLERLGAILRGLHELEAPGLPAWDEQGARDATARDLSWVAFMRPELGELAAGLAALIERAAPPIGLGRPRVCHGDFVPSQVLADGESWSVIDFDLCRYGDPYHDLAILLAALPYDVPALRDAPDALLRRAVTACVGGYEDRAGAPLERGRLLWHRLCAEIYYLGLALKKDWLDLAGYQRALDRLRALAAELEEAL